MLEQTAEITVARPDFSVYKRCDGCPFRGRKKVPSSGNPETCKYVLVGEAPGRNEVNQGKPFVGETGVLLRAFLSQVGLDPHSDDFYLMNALSCQVRRKTDVNAAVYNCRERVYEELNYVIREHMRRGIPIPTIVLMGLNARNSVFPGAQGGILGSRGWSKYKGQDVYISVHPSYFLYNPTEAQMLIKDIQRWTRGKQPPIGPFELNRALEEQTQILAIGEMPWGEHREEEVTRYQDNEQFWTWNKFDRQGYTTWEEVKRGQIGYQAYILDTPELLSDFYSLMYHIEPKERGFIAFDIETDQVDYQRDRILCLSISPIEGLAFIIPDSLLYLDGHEFVTTNWSKKKWERFTQHFKYLTGSYLRPDWGTAATLRGIFGTPGYKWVGQNSKFDMRFLYNIGVRNVRCDFDTIVAHYVLDERPSGHGLKAMADDYFDVGDYESDLFKYITKKSAHYSRVPREVLYGYNAMDTECTLRLARVLDKELREQDLFERPFSTVLMRALPMLFSAELSGVFVDWEEVDRIEDEELQPEIEKLRDRLRKISGNPTLNPLSSKRVNDILYDEMHMPFVEARTRAGGNKVGGRSSQKAIMDAWDKLHQLGKLDVSEEAWEFVQTLKEYRHLRKLLGSYIRKWRNLRGTDDRVHTNFLLRGTVTGRLAAKDPPMQTIPSKVTDRWGPMVANMHKAQPGWKLMYADYSQAELMVLAELSQDEFMLDAFKRGADYHTEVALAAYGENWTRDQRQACKKLTFGWAYGGTVKEIAMDALQFDGPVAERFAKEWDDMFPGAVAWRRAQGDFMERNGYVQSIYGRRRRQPLITRVNKGKARRIAINAPIQSAVSDFNLMSATRLYERYRDTDYARVVLLIHDSIVMEVRDDKIDEVREVMRETMLDVPREFFPDISFKAEVKVSDQLGDLTT